MLKITETMQAVLDVMPVGEEIHQDEIYRRLGRNRGVGKTLIALSNQGLIEQTKTGSPPQGHPNWEAFGGATWRRLTSQ